MNFLLIPGILSVVSGGVYSYLSTENIEIPVAPEIGETKERNYPDYPLSSFIPLSEKLIQDQKELLKKPKPYMKLTNVDDLNKEIRNFNIKNLYNVATNVKDEFKINYIKEQINKIKSELEQYRKSYSSAFRSYKSDKAKLFNGSEKRSGGSKGSKKKKRKFTPFTPFINNVVSQPRKNNHQVIKGSCPKFQGEYNGGVGYSMVDK